MKISVPTKNHVNHANQRPIVFMINEKSLLRAISLFGILFAAAALTADWLRTPGFGPKGAALAVLGLLIAAAPLFRTRKFENWRLEPKIFLPALLVIAAALNAYLMIRNPNIGGDALWFHSSFHNLIEGNGYLNPYTGDVVEPGYGMLSYPFYLLFGSIELSGMLVSAIAYLLIIPTTYFTVDYLFGRRSAVLAAWLIALWPALLSFSYVSLSDMAFALFALLGFSLYARILAGQTRLPRYILLGAALGMAYLLREAEGLWLAGLVLASLFVFAVIDSLRARGQAQPLRLRSKTLLRPFSTALIFSLAVLFYAGLIHSQFGEWAVFSRVENPRQPPSWAAATAVAAPAAAPAEPPSPDPVAEAAPAAERPSLADRFRNSFMALTGTPPTNWPLFRQNLRTLGARVLGMNAHAIAPLALLGLLYPLVSRKRLFARWRPKAHRWRLLFAFAVFISPVLLLIVAVDRTALRYYLSDFVYVVILSAVLTVRLLEGALKALSKRGYDLGVAVVGLAAVLVSLGFGTPNLPETLTARHAHQGLRAAGLWLREHAPAPADVSILAPTKGQVTAFYASGEKFSTQYGSIPYAQTLDKIGALVNTTDFDYLVLDDYYVHQQPHLEALWHDPGSAQESGLLLLHHDPQGRFQIYVGEN